MVVWYRSPDESPNSFRFPVTVVDGLLKQEDYPNLTPEAYAELSGWVLEK